MYKDQEGYLDLLESIMLFGGHTPDRTSVGGSHKLLNVSLEFDLREGFPLHTIRSCPVRWAFEEFWFFMSGNTDTKLLEEKGITLWKENTTREFLNNRGMLGYNVGDMGKAYGYQWRNFNGEGVDQLSDTVKLLKEDPYSRRILTTFWNPAQSHSMALTPCFYEHKFSVTGIESKVLHLTVKSRSCDALFGLPFNYMQYALYLKAMSQLVGMEAGTLHITMDDVHLYDNQIEYASELVSRRKYDWVGTLEEILDQKIDININKDLNTVEDLVNISWEDISFSEYLIDTRLFKTEKPKMAV